jgi:hypothetical protein
MKNYPTLTLTGSLQLRKNHSLAKLGDGTEHLSHEFGCWCLVNERLRGASGDQDDAEVPQPSIANLLHHQVTTNRDSKKQDVPKCIIFLQFFGGTMLSKVSGRICSVGWRRRATSTHVELSRRIVRTNTGVDVATAVPCNEIDQAPARTSLKRLVSHRIDSSSLIVENAARWRAKNSSADREQ